MDTSSDLFGAIIGDLPLLRLKPKAIAKLAPGMKLQFLDQLNQHCIRRAWLDATRTRTPVRQILDLRAAQAAVKLASAVYGRAPDEHGLRTAILSARSENEFRTCFGFFLKGEIDHLLEHASPGPVLRARLYAHSRPPSGTYLYGRILYNGLKGYRAHARANTIARDTVDLVQHLTGMDSHLRSLPDGAQSYFDFSAALLEGVTKMEARFAMNPLEREPFLKQLETSISMLEGGVNSGNQQDAKSESNGTCYDQWVFKSN